MATQTRTIGTLHDAAGATAVLQYDWDDVTIQLLTARVINGLSVPVHLQLTRTSDGRVYGPFSVAAQTTVAQSIPTSGPARFGLTLDARGRLDGADVSFWT